MPAVPETCELQHWTVGNEWPLLHPGWKWTEVGQFEMCAFLWKSGALKGLQGSMSQQTGSVGGAVVWVPGPSFPLSSQNPEDVS